MDDDISRIVADLRRPAAYEHAVEDVVVVQTHISYVFLAGEYAYKLKKPLNLGFLDYSTVELRRRMCEAEVRLNRRLCEGVYLGVVPITRGAGGAYRVGGDDDAVEHVVRMARVPVEQTMPHLLHTRALTREQLARLAGKIASFHHGAETNDRIAAFGRVAAVRSNWEENFEQTAEFVGRTITAAHVEAVRVYADRFLREHAALIEERAETGRVRDGHGDLRSESVVLASNGSVCVMDCIEFSERLRCGDIASDVAFLAMDLERRGYRREADEFVSMYMESLSSDETLPAVLNFYRCYRAFVRGKVDSIQSAEPEVPDAQRIDATRSARQHFSLAASYAALAFPRAVIMMIGLSGTGKSFLARALAARAGAALVRTDAIRREMTDPEELGPGPFESAAYGPAQRLAVYGWMMERARRHLDAGRAAVLDGTFLARTQRDLARELALSGGVPLLAVYLDAPEAVVRDRLRGRDDDSATDARWDTYVGQRRAFEPLDDVDPARLVVLESTAPLNALVDRVLAALPHT